MNRPVLAALALLLAAAPASAGDEPAPAPTPDRVVIADSTELVYRATDERSQKLLSDVDRDAAETIMAINRTRGTWQSYLGYTSPELKVPLLRPGFTFTFGPPSRKELERRRRVQDEARRKAADHAPEPIAEVSPES